MITIYGKVRSRAPRVLWLADEIGLDYQHVPTDHRAGEAKEPEFLAINPNGKIPVLVDGDLTLVESMAINLYLARKYAKAPLWPTSEGDQALVNQWSYWGMTGIEPGLLKILIEILFKTEEERDSSVIDAAAEELKRPLTVLENHLSDRDYLLGGEFTVADLNLASIISLQLFAEYDICAPYPRAQAWLNRCLSRPAFQQVMASG